MGGLVARVEAYDPDADSWRAVADLPQPMHHANLAAVAGELLLAGFLEGLTFEARGDVWAYDPSADAWSARTPLSACVWPSPRPEPLAAREYPPRVLPCTRAYTRGTTPE